MIGNPLFRSAALLLMAAYMPVSSRAQTIDEDMPSARAMRQQRLTEAAAKLTITDAENPNVEYPQWEQPLLDYTNPVGDAQSEGLVTLWHDEGVPLVMAAFSERRGDRIFREMVSLTSRPLICSNEGGTIWSPEQAAYEPQRFPDAGTPPKSKALRLSVMRRLADRVRVTKTGDNPLRLLSQPLYRFESAEQDIVDGAIFAFVEANDPEFLLILTANSTAECSTVTWHYSVARMTAAPCEVILDNQSIWSTKGYWTNARTPGDAYVEQLDRMLNASSTD